MGRVLTMRVIQHQRAAEAVAVIKNDRAARVPKLRQRRVCDDPAVDAARLAGNRSNDIEIVNRVIQHLETGTAFQERPLLPRLPRHEPHFDVGDLAQPIARQQILQGQYVRAEPQLKVDRGDERTLATHLEDPPRGVEMLAHRLLNENRRLRRQPAQDAGDLVARHRNVENDIR